jgi:hypothetical protein
MVLVLALLNTNLWATSIRSQRYKSPWNVFILHFRLKMNLYSRLWTNEGPPNK